MQTEGQQDGRGYEEARIKRERALEALYTLTDKAAGISLWRTVGRYTEQMKATGDAYGSAPGLPHDRALGVGTHGT